MWRVNGVVCVWVMGMYNKFSMGVGCAKSFLYAYVAGGVIMPIWS